MRLVNLTHFQMVKLKKYKMLTLRWKNQKTICFYFNLEWI